MPEQSCAPKGDRISLSVTDGPRILVTRPLPQAERTAKKLRAMGYNPIIAPMLAIVPVAPATIPDFKAAQAVLVTSSNGVDALARMTELRGFPVLTVGDRTAAIARSAGFEAVQSASGDGQALLDLAMGSLNPGAGRILHIRGKDAAFSFESLADKSFNFQQVIGYEAQIVENLPPEVNATPPQAALVYSARTATALAAALARTDCNPTEITFFGISAAALAPLSPLGGQMITASAPDEASLLQTLQSAIPPSLKK